MVLLVEFSVSVELPPRPNFHLGKVTGSIEATTTQDLMPKARELNPSESRDGGYPHSESE